MHVAVPPLCLFLFPIHVSFCFPGYRHFAYRRLFRLPCSCCISIIIARVISCLWSYRLMLTVRRLCSGPGLAKLDASRRSSHERTHQVTRGETNKGHPNPALVAFSSFHRSPQNSPDRAVPKMTCYQIQILPPGQGFSPSPSLCACFSPSEPSRRTKSMGFARCTSAAAKGSPHSLHLSLLRLPTSLIVHRWLGSPVKFTRGDPLLCRVR